MSTAEAHVNNTDVDALSYCLSPHCLMDMWKKSKNSTEMGKDLGVEGCFS